uniref:Nuclear envelope pore membrane protein POM 121 n=1 Tax=Rousettus aegyptiacus TaxID=9407 RepID=A0A7J8FJP3_ROUAE|nr:hypothetical protein HJG63_012154 [Rousettus aegyptiacus]
MGSYLSRPRSRPPSPVLPGGDRREGPDRLGPVSPARRLSPACRVHSRGRSLDLASPHCRRNHRRFVIVHRRQYPIQQTRCLFLGVFASVPRSSPQKPLLSACSCKMLCTSVILKMASAKGKLMLRLALKQTVICMWSSLSGHLLNPGGKETRMKALEQGCQLKAKEEQDPAALVDSRTGLWGPASNHAQGPVEKGSGESQRPSLSASAEAQRGTTLEKVQDISSGQNLRSCLPPLDNPRPLKRKIPLLMPSKQDDPLILPPAPQLGYRVTTEDFDLEKKIALQWINKVLEG